MTATDQTIPTERDDVFVEGDSAKITVEIENDDGTPLDLTGKSVVFSLAPYPGRETVVSKSTTDGDVQITDATNGVAVVELSPEDTSDLGARGGRDYHFEVQLNDGESVVVTVTRGTLTIHESTV
jgi:hypothetical protein